MPYRVQITEARLSREHQAELAALLVAHTGVTPEEAELSALMTPCAVGPVATAEARDGLLEALAAAGFGARATGEAPGDPPAEASRSLAAPETSPLDEPPSYEPLTSEEPVYEAPAPAAPPSVPARTNWGAVVLGVAAIAAAAVVAVVVLTRPAPLPVVVENASAPPGYAGAEAPEVVYVDETPEPVEAADAAPEPPDEADFERGFDPRRGVNWDVFASETQVRYAAAPGRTPIPIRDAPSGRHGRAVGEVSSGGAVRTDGCLPRRPEDGGRWCRTADGQGWIYDRYLATSPPPTRSAPASEPTSVLVVLGSYAIGDDAGLQARYAEANRTGLGLEIGPSERFGMKPGYTVIISGPYDNETSLRVLAQAQRVVPDAFRRSLR